jgi:hypothetical protein
MAVPAPVWTGAATTQIILTGRRASRRHTVGVGTFAHPGGEDAGRDARAFGPRLKRAQQDRGNEYAGRDQGHQLKTRGGDHVDLLSAFQR